MDAITRILKTLKAKLRPYSWDFNAGPMTTQEIVKAITSNSDRKVWRGACGIAHQCQDRDKILPLVPYLPQIKSKAVELKMADSLLAKLPSMDLAIKAIELHRSNRECPCNLYMGLPWFNPTDEVQKGYLKMLNIVREVNRVVDYYIVRCERCGNVFQVFERRRRNAWWKWTINMPDAWTFDYNRDFPSPDKTHRLVYDGYLCEVAMGGPLRGECFLETNDDQRFKVHHTCGGPPLWETTGQFVAIPIWTEHRNHRLGVLNVTTKELILFKDSFGDYHLHTGSFDKNVIRIDSRKFDIEKKRIEQIIKLA